MVRKSDYKKRACLSASSFLIPPGWRRADEIYGKMHESDNGSDNPSYDIYLVYPDELGHLEMVGAIVHQLTRSMTEQEVKDAGYEAYFVDHTAGVYPTAASGFPWNAASMAVKGDLIADLTEDLAAEQKARVTYDNILRLSDDPDVNDVIKFLRAREIVHFQRFGEGLRLAKEKMDQKNLYFVNPSFDQ